MPKLKFNVQPETRLNIKPENNDSNDNKLNNTAELLDKIGTTAERMPFNIKFIPRDKIVTNDKNTFAQVEIEKLAESILHLGLIHNLEAMYDEEHDIYILESGERRLRAIDMLIEKYGNAVSEELPEEDRDLFKLYQMNIAGFKKGYPLNVKRGLDTDSENNEQSRLSEINSELRLIAANYEVRPDDPQSRLSNIARYNTLLEEKNSLLPRRLRVNINQAIAENEGISTRQVIKYKDVLSLIPELQEEFTKNNITLSDGSSYSKLSEEEQYTILKLIKSGEKIKADEVRLIKESFEKNQLLLKEKEDELVRQEEKLSDMQKEQQSLQDIIDGHNNQVDKLKEDFEKEKVSIKNQLEEELKKDNVNTDEVNKLKKDLESVKELHDKKLQEEQEKLKQKETEIAELQKKYDEYVKKVSEQDEKDTVDLDKTIKETQLRLRIESSIHELEKAFNSISKYNEQDSSITSSYSKKIADIVDKYCELYI